MVAIRSHVSHFSLPIRIALAIGVLAIGLVAIPQAADAAPGKISLTPSEITLTEGQTQIVSVSLQQPIICTVMDATCEVSIPLVSSDPTRVTTDVSHVTFPFTEWHTTKTFTITTLDDHVVNASNTVSVTSTAVSNSVFYSGFNVSAVVTLTDVGVTTTAGFGEAMSQSSTAGPGDTVSVSGVGFKADTDVTATLHSTPTVLGTIRTNSVGSFSGTFTIPTSAALGAHQIIISGLNISGAEVTAAMSLTVGGELAATGRPVQFQLIVACALLCAGFGAHFASKRKSLIHY